MKRILLSAFLLSSLLLSASAQNKQDEVLMTIAGKPVYLQEFLNIYQKNNVKGETIDKKSLAEYRDLFINFKLKVREAEELGLDTVSTFRNELNGYREQLAKPYFTDEATLEKLVKEAYERGKFDLRASHIYFKVSPDAPPADTLAAFKKAMEVREKIMNGASFEAMALEYSEDPSAKDREATSQHPFLKGNRGDLGFFSVFDMVYPFENGAWKTEIGKVSAPVRTDYGYHLIKVYDRRPALGKVTVAHIFTAIPKNATRADSMRLEMRIDSVYQKLKAGETFEELVREYSDDKGSAAKGGVLPSFGVNRMVPEFVEALYSIPELGGYSKPILTSYGWHIIKLIDKKVNKPLEEEKAEIRQKILKDSRGEQSRQVVLERIRNEYGVTTQENALKGFYGWVTDSIFHAKWKIPAGEKLDKQLVRIGNVNYLQQDFAEYLISTQRRQESQPVKQYVDKMFATFVDDNLLKWENSQLETKYPEFRALMTEYRDGILLFDLTDQKVWSKAVKDTVGLTGFYEKNKENYKWDTRLDASIYKVKDPSRVDAVRRFVQSGMSDTDLLKEINQDTLKILSVESGKFSRKDNSIIDSIPWNTGMTGNILIDGLTGFVNVRAVLQPMVKELNEARGMITADYQNYLEKEWVETLRKKYPVVVKEEIFQKIN